MSQKNAQSRPADTESGPADDHDKNEEKAEQWTDRRELRVDATPEQMFRAWADPDILAGWFPDRAWGEAVEGGEIVQYFEAFDMEMPYKVLEVDAPNLLVLEGRAPSGQPFRQEIRIEHRDGQTVLELVHSGFSAESDWDEEYEGVDSGWQLAFAVLRQYLENHFGRPKKTLFVAHPAEFDWHRLSSLFRAEDGLARWLTVADGGEIGEIDTAVELSLRDAGSLSGRVLADSGREIALEWNEIEGVLELKAFGGGPWPTTLALRVSSWADDREQMLDRLRPPLEASLDRLVDVAGAAPA